MSLQVLTAGAACGKTTEMLNRVRSELSTTELKKIWVVLPDRRQVNSYRAKLIDGGSILGVSFGLFSDISTEILMKSDQIQTPAASTMIHRIVLEIVQVHSQQGKLGELEVIKDKPGFIQLLHQKFTELMQAGYTVNECEIDDAQLRVILDLYQSYQARLSQLQRLDPNQIVRLAVSELAANPRWVQDWDLVVVDGFDRFTNPQQELICQLSEAGVRVMLTLAGDDPHDRVIYQRAQASLVKLRSAIPDLEVISLGYQPHLPASIRGLANNFLVVHPQKIEKQQDVRLLAAHSPLQEVREVLRYIKELLASNQSNAKDCAILVPDEAQYPPLLQSVAYEYGIPIHFSWGTPLQDVAQIRFLIDLLRLELENFPRRLFLDVLRSPYLDLSEFGFLASDTARMEQISRSGPVIAGLENWIKVLRRLAEQTLESEQQLEDEEDQDDIFSLPDAITSGRLLECVQNFATKNQAPQGQRSISFWVEWLWQLLGDIGWLAKIGSSESKTWFDCFRRVLREMSISDLNLNSWLLDYGQFVNELEMVFQVSTFYQNPQQNQVQVLRFLDARGSRFEHVAILGLAEGVYPKFQREDPFLPEVFRRSAGLELRLEQDQIGVFYQGITRANATLMVTRPYMSDKGEALEPSPYWNILAAALEEKDIDVVRSTTRRDLSEAASIEELLFWSRLFNQPLLIDDQKLIEMTDTLQHQQQVLSARQNKMADGEYEGRMASLPSALEKYNQNKTNWSASRLETYKSCPLRFWTQYALDVEEQSIPEVGTQAFQLGSILHQILEDVYLSAEDPADESSVMDQLPAVAKRIFDAAPQEYQFEPTPYWQIQQQEWLLILEQTIRGLASDEWVPIAFEQKFGLDGKPPLAISLDIPGEFGRVVHLHGVIDRVEKDTQGNIRVIDYKTGMGHLDKKDLLEGTRLQLPLYALAAGQALGFGEVTDGFYWSLNRKKEGSLKLRNFQADDFEGPSGAIQVAIQHIEQIMEGISTADFHPQVPSGGCPTYCPARLWCWRYRPGR